jgi:tetratricopeptide (TPR) repeat protein
MVGVFPMRPPLDAITTLLDEGAADSAVRMLRSSWEPDMAPGDRVPHYCLWIRGLCDIGDHEHALVLARRAAAEFPREPEVLTALGNVCDLCGLVEEAHDAFAVAVDVDPGGVLNHYNLGAVLERLGEEEQAEDRYRRAIELDEQSPTIVEANAALGALLRRNGRLDEALEVYEAYLEEDPLDIDMLVEHGICLSDLERLDEAIERFKTALSLDRNHSGAWYNQAITYYRMVRTEDAIQSLEAALSVDPDNPLTLAVLGAWKLGQPPEKRDLDEALSLIYRGVDELVQLSDREGVAVGYAALVCEEAFEALWQAERPAEARELARVAGRNGWITPHVLETLNRADNGLDESAATFRVTARAQPDDTATPFVDLTVVAGDEDDARDLALRYLQELHRDGTVQFEVETVSPDPESEAGPRSRGVTQVRL